MAILKIHEQPIGFVRHGCAVYSFNRDAEGVISKDHLHAGIYIGPDTVLEGTLPKMRVEHRPPGQCPNEVDLWNILSAEHYRVDVVGQISEEEGASVQLKDVANVAALVRLDHSHMPTVCGWSQSEDLQPRPDGGTNSDIPIFKKGSCTHFVEFCYKHAGIPIVNRSVTRDPTKPFRIAGATQIYMFASGRLNESVAWHEDLTRYPECLKLLQTS